MRVGAGCGCGDGAGSAGVGSGVSGLTTMGGVTGAGGVTTGGVLSMTVNACVLTALLFPALSVAVISTV